MLCKHEHDGHLDGGSGGRTEDPVEDPSDLTLKGLKF